MIGRPISELNVGDEAELTRVVTPPLIGHFTDTVGDDNPLHSNETFAASLSFRTPIAPGILTGGLISAVIGTKLPGPGSLYISQEFRFLKPVYEHDTITARVRVAEIIAERNRVRLETVAVNQHGEVVLAGDAWVKPPKQRIVWEQPRGARFMLTSLPWTWPAYAVRTWSRAAADALAGWRQSSAT